MTIADLPSSDDATFLAPAGRSPLGDERFALATLDAATGLPNQLLFDDRGRRALAQAERMGAGVGLLAIGYELEGYAGIRDDDALRKQIGRALEGMLRKADTLAALADDLFVVLLAPAGAGFDTLTVAHRFDALLARLVLPGIRLRTVIGIARYPEDADSLTDLLERAEQAMHLARRCGTRVERHEVRGALRPTVATSAATRHAESDTGWRYQPWFDARVSRPVGIEARCPAHPGLRCAGSGFSVALREFRDFRSAGLAIEVLGLACGPALFDHADLPRRLDAERAAVGLEARNLRLFVDARHLVAASSERMARLRALRDAGYGLVLDDFLGASDGLAALTATPLDGLRIGRSAIAALGSERGGSSARRRVVAAIGAAGSLSLDLMACGIDEKVRRDLLTVLGVRHLQGDALCPPMTATELRNAWRTVDDGAACGRSGR